jgi:Alpha/beta hydrolase family
MRPGDQPGESAHQNRNSEMETVTSGDGTRIAFDRTGRGRPVILVPGAFSYRRFPGQVKLAEQLASHFTVLSFDRRGRGESGDTPPYHVEREIEDLQALCDAAWELAYVPGHAAKAVAANLPNAELVTRKGLGHAKKLTPKVISATLAEFFSD